MVAVSGLGVSGRFFKRPLNGGLEREYYENGLKLGMEIILNYFEGVRSSRFVVLASF